MMIGGFLLGGQTCTFQWPAPSLGVNMSNPYPWYLSKFFGIGLALWRKSQHRGNNARPRYRFARRGA